MWCRNSQFDEASDVVVMSFMLMRRAVEPFHGIAFDERTRERRLPDECFPIAEMQ